MSLMNDALRSLDDSYRRCNTDVKSIKYIHGESSNNQTAINDLAFDCQDNDVFNNVNIHENNFFYFYRYFFIKLFFIVLFVFGSAGYFFMYEFRSEDKPVLYDNSYPYKIIQPSFYLNSLLYRFGDADQQDTINTSKVSGRNISDRDVNGRDVNNTKENNKYEVDGKRNNINDEQLGDELTRKTKSISLLNNKGYAALAGDFLSTPKRKNAIYYFRQVLAIDENDILARQGIDSVYRRYQKLILSNIERREWLQAEIMLSRFLAVGGSEGDVESYKQIISKNINKDKHIEVVTKESIDFRENKKSYLLVEKSNDYLEKEAFFRSQQWVKSNQIQKAIDELNIILQTQKYLTKSTAEFLFDLYLHAGNIDAARVVSDHVRNVKKTKLNNNSWDSVYENARIEQVQSGDLAALSLLQKVNVEWLGESSARLYAGLLQKNGNYTLAQDIYRNLLSMYDKNATYWLGYGVSSDALGQLSNALIGYQKTQILGGVSLDVQSYIVNRISILQSSVHSSSHVMEPSW